MNNFFCGEAGRPPLRVPGGNERRGLAYGGRVGGAVEKVLRRGGERSEAATAFDRRAQCFDARICECVGYEVVGDYFGGGYGAFGRGGNCSRCVGA